MIEELFNSKIRTKVLSLFFKKVDSEFYPQEIISKAKTDSANTHRELAKLCSLGILKKTKKTKRTYYSINKNNVFYDGLKKVFKEFNYSEEVYQKIFTRRLYPPSLMLPVAEITVDGLGDLIKSDIKIAGSYWENEESTYFFSKNQLDNTVDRLVRDALVSPRKIIEILKVAYEKAVVFNKKTEKYINQKLGKVKTKELIDHYKKAMAKFSDMYKYGTVPVLVGYSDDNEVYKKAENIIKEKIKKNSDDFSLYYVALTTAPYKTVMNDLERDICLLAKKAIENKVTTKKQLQQKYSRELKLIYDEYIWLSYNTKDAITWDLDHFADLVFKKLDIDVEKELLEIENYEKDVKKSFNKAVKDLKLTKEEIIPFEILRYLGYYKWAREYDMFKGLYNLMFIQNELARRCGIKGVDFRYLRLSEIEELFKNVDKYKKIIKSRKKHYLVFSLPGGKYISYDGKEAKEKFEKIKFFSKSSSLGNVDVLKGLPASPGKLKGKIKIINVVRHMDKMEKDNILVSVATTPDLITAMKKASAIITDEGGVTCHAAIVSRELKIPCIVGTKNATKILSDGDEVELDANNGIVKILNK